MASRPIDHGFDALVEVTGANVSAERGALNAALKQIKEALDGEVEGELLGTVIRQMAERYRKLWPDMALTATALAKHWNRISLEEQERAKPVTYVSSDGVQCSSCDGLRLVLVGHQQPRPSTWALENRDAQHPELGLPHPAHRRPEDGFEIYMPCPDCNQKGLEAARIWRARFARTHY